MCLPLAVEQPGHAIEPDDLLWPAALHDLREPSQELAIAKADSNSVSKDFVRERKDATSTLDHAAAHGIVGSEHWHQRHRDVATTPQIDEMIELGVRPAI